MKTKELKSLWQLAFGDSMEFIDLFFRTAYAPERCCFLTEEDRVTAALYWLDCETAGQKQAYLYAVATHPDHRGKGLCNQLMTMTHSLLKQQGYTGAMLRPADPGLRRMYGKLGYHDCTTVSEFHCAAANPIPVKEIGVEEYARLRRKFLPHDGVLQKGVSLSYLASYCAFYTGEDFLLAGSAEGQVFHGTELLGSRTSAPEILSALGCKEGFFRCPGHEIPFGMFLPLTENAAVPGYLGLAFD